MTNLDRMKAHYQQIDQWHRKRGLDPHHQILTEPVMRHIERLEGRVQALEGALKNFVEQFECDFVLDDGTIVDNPSVNLWSPIETCYKQAQAALAATGEEGQSK
jgi:hypothetical protein